MDELNTLVFEALRRGEPSVEVPARLILSLPHSDHPTRWPWIPGLDDRPPACGAYLRVLDRFVELWCLKPEDHPPPHGWE